MSMTSFDFDERTMKAIEALKDTFNVKTNAAVIRRALALALVVAEKADDKHSILLIGKDEPVRVNLT